MGSVQMHPTSAQRFPVAGAREQGSICLEVSMYIGVGTIVVILIIVLLVVFLRRR
jgi:hypothetical protein